MAAKQDRRELGPPQTLIEAHDAIARDRPVPDADLGSWLTFHQRNARLYAVIADIDRGHHHEALYWVSNEQRNAVEVAEQIKKVKYQHNSRQ